MSGYFLSRAPRFAFPLICGVIVPSLAVEPSHSLCFHFYDLAQTLRCNRLCITAERQHPPAQPFQRERQEIHYHSTCH